MYFHHLPHLSDPLGWLLVVGGLSAIGLAAYIEWLRVSCRREDAERRTQAGKPRRRRGNH